MPAYWIAATTPHPPSGLLRAVAVDHYIDSRRMLTALSTIWDTTFRGDTDRLLDALFAHTGWDALDPSAQPGRLAPVGGGIAVPGVGWATPPAFAPPARTTGWLADLLNQAGRVVVVHPATGQLSVHERHRRSWTHRLSDGPPRPRVREW